MNTFEKVAELLAQRKGTTPDTISPDSQFGELALDSLDVAELVMDLEDAFNVTIEITKDMTCVADLVKAIDGAKQ
ncbi:MAG: phosphopantetheine-binding protein [Candidatus Limiplasma sp.]|nr:phosphopantetheine-binding protein [Candidatus Limiplasma sp.]